MSNIDWQAYLDGSLSQEERAAAEVQLATDPAARAELDGLRAFIALVRKAGRSQHVPIDRLRARLSAVARPSRVHWIQRSAVAVVAAAVLVFAFFYARVDPDRLNQTATQASFATANPLAAAEWLRKHGQKMAPVIDLGTTAVVQTTSFGQDWGCYEFLVDGVPYRIYMTTKEASFTQRPQKVLPCGTLTYSARGTGFCAQGCNFYVVGPDQATREHLASVATRYMHEHCKDNQNKTEQSL